MKNRIDLYFFCGYDIYMNKRGRPKKDPSETKGDYLEVRLDPAEKRAFRSAAGAAGLPLSAWVRERLRRIARHELEEIGLPIPFLQIK